MSTTEVRRQSFAGGWSSFYKTSAFLKTKDGAPPFVFSMVAGNELDRMLFFGPADLIGWCACFRGFVFGVEFDDWRGRFDSRAEAG